MTIYRKRTSEEIRNTLQFCDQLPSAGGVSGQFYYCRADHNWYSYEKGEWRGPINPAYVFADYDAIHEPNPYNTINTTSHDHNP